MSKFYVKEKNQKKKIKKKKKRKYLLMILRKLSHYSNKRKLSRKKWLEFKSQQSKYLEFILKTKVKRQDKKEKEMKRKEKE